MPTHSLGFLGYFCLMVPDGKLLFAREATQSENDGSGNSARSVARPLFVSARRPSESRETRPSPSISVTVPPGTPASCPDNPTSSPLAPPIDS